MEKSTLHQARNRGVPCGRRDGQQAVTLRNGLSKGSNPGTGVEKNKKKEEKGGYERGGWRGGKNTFLRNDGWAKKKNVTLAPGF